VLAEERFADASRTSEGGKEGPMINRDAAKRIAENYVNESYFVEGDRLVILEEKTVEKEYGWIFFYDSLKSMEGDDRYLIAGNGPLIVDKNDGSVHLLPTVPPLEDWIARYEAQRLKY
jgi:hypothetical protein